MPDMRRYREILIDTPPLVEAADTPAFFHDSNAATIEHAVAFYTTDGHRSGGRTA